MKSPFQSGDEIQGVDLDGESPFVDQGNIIPAPLDIEPLLRDPIYSAPDENEAATERSLTLNGQEIARQAFLDKGGSPNKDEVVRLLRDSTWKAARNIRNLIAGNPISGPAQIEKLRQEQSKWLLEQFLGKAAQLEKPLDLDSLSEKELLEIATTGTLTTR